MLIYPSIYTDELDILTMALLSLGIGFGLLVLTLSWTFSNLTAKRRCQAEAARQGCMPAPAVPHKGFWGLTRLLEVLKATQEERGPQQIVEIMNELGTKKEVHTARLESKSHCTRPITESLRFCFKQCWARR